MGELKYRTRIGIVLDNTIADWLKAENENTGIPQSRIIEKALVEVYGKKIEEFKKLKCQEE